jgi:YegS/Rv2252/BmrU family lipid kinase
MKYYFIINPVAGKKNASTFLVKDIEKAFDGSKQTYQIYITTGVGDATSYVKAICDTLTEPATFFACGGDGTVNEVVNGLIDSPSATLGIIPVGSCNDFIKSLPDVPYMDIKKQIEGTVMPIDILKVNDNYTINVANIGYDSNVNDDCNRIKGRLGVKLAYNLAILHNLLWKMKNYADITIDGEEFSSGQFLLMVMANGRRYGGSYICAPRAKVNDGLLDVCLIKKVGRLKLLQLIKYYKLGTHLDNPKLKGMCFYKQGRHVSVKARKPISVCLDGDDIKLQEISIDILPGKIRLLIPKTEKANG